MTGASKNMVIKLVVDTGRACADYQYNALRDLPCKRLQFDEIWSFVYAKQDNVPDGQWKFFDMLFKQAFPPAQPDLFLAEEIA